jgi:hypothetical protein
VSITFSEPLLEGSELQVLDECERRVDDDLRQIMANEMSVGIVEESSGTYKVSYTAVGPTGTGTGWVTFTVHGGAACGPASGNHHGADSGGGGSGAHGGGGHGGGGGGAGSGGTEPGHSGSEAGHNQDSTDVGATARRSMPTVTTIAVLGATHTVDDAGDHAAARGGPTPRSPVARGFGRDRERFPRRFFICGGSGARWAAHGDRSSFVADDRRLCDRGALWRRRRVAAARKPLEEFLGPSVITRHAREFSSPILTIFLMASYEDLRALREPLETVN